MYEIGGTHMRFINKNIFHFNIFLLYFNYQQRSWQQDNPTIFIYKIIPKISINNEKKSINTPPNEPNPIIQSMKLS